MIPKIWLRKGKEKAIQRKHHWIFSGALFKVPKGILNGQLTDIHDSNDQFICRGLYHDASIAFRVLSFEDIPIDLTFWKLKLQLALVLRTNCQIIQEHNNIFRLFHGEGDGIPGLVVDIYKDTAVIQLHYPGLQQFLIDIKQSIRSLDLPIDNIVVRTTYHEVSSEEKSTEQVIHAKENSINFLIYPITGQKTGFFI